MWEDVVKISSGWNFVWEDLRVGGLPCGRISVWEELYAGGVPCERNPMREESRP